MKWIARVLIFTAAFVFGTFAGSLFWGQDSGLSDHVVEAGPPLTADSLRGTWAGRWGYNDGECIIEIYRVKGNAFFGTLRKEGAEVRFEGTFDPTTRTLRFTETKVVRLGSQMSEWSLGTNAGTISPDARTIAGTGRDKWGQYEWAASNN